MLDYIIIGLLVIVIILIIIAISKNVNEGKITERLGTLETNTVKELSSFQIDIMKTMNDNFNGLNDRMEKKLTQINDKVNERLDDNFAKTNRTFTNILERLSKIDEAQKKIDTLSTDIVSLQSILTDKKSRGIFGEINLKHILVSIFGEKNDKVYRLQYTFPNTTIADAVIFAPEPLGTVAIDSKFPLEHYQKMVDKNLSQVDRNMAEKEFKIDVKKHIDAIANKYNTTVDALKKANNLTSNILSIGQVLKIPTVLETETGITYTVKSGDSLYSIARKYNTTVDAIKSLNNLSSNLLSIGQALKIPTGASLETTYTVQKGDSLYSIAKKFNTTVATLKELNNLTSNLLSIGQILIVR